MADRPPQGPISVEPRVPHLVDLAHPARAQRRQDLAGAGADSGDDHRSRVFTGSTLASAGGLRNRPWSHLGAFKAIVQFITTRIGEGDGSPSCALTRNFWPSAETSKSHFMNPKMLSPEG